MTRPQTSFPLSVRIMRGRPGLRHLIEDAGDGQATDRMFRPDRD